MTVCGVFCCFLGWKEWTKPCLIFSACWILLTCLNGWTRSFRARLGSYGSTNFVLPNPYSKRWVLLQKRNDIEFVIKRYIRIQNFLEFGPNMKQLWNLLNSFQHQEVILGENGNSGSILLNQLFKLFFWKLTKYFTWLHKLTKYQPCRHWLYKSPIKREYLQRILYCNCNTWNF